jgi:hypothetical protein
MVDAAPPPHSPPLPKRFCIAPVRHHHVSLLKPKRKSNFLLRVRLFLTPQIYLFILWFFGEQRAAGDDG